MTGRVRREERLPPPRSRVYLRQPRRSRGSTEESDPQRRQARGSLHHIQALEHRSQA